MARTAPGPALPHYKMDRYQKMVLPSELEEISGLAYYQKDNALFAISDANGYLYKITPPNKIQRWLFSNKTDLDIEEVALVDSTFYVLRSNGDIMRLEFQHGDTLSKKEYKFKLGDGEFEICYYDKTRKKLVMICKDCDSDKKKSLTTYTFDPATEEYSDQSFSIDVKDIAHKVGEKKMKFKPSAAAINPKNNLLYIVSSINKLIIITDLNGKLKDVYPIDRATFKQPEGMAFKPSGEMVISNEAADIGAANILFFSYNN